MNIGALKRCEDVLQKLHEKVEKVGRGDPFVLFFTLK
jgi:hypothetical protein